jgi:hypothetical protein
MSYASTSIIKKGLHGRACRGLITTKFSLLCKPVEVIIQPGGPASTGGSPYYPTRVDYDDYDNDVYDQPQCVTIKVHLDNHTFERSYEVGKKRAYAIVKLSNFINVAHERFNVFTSYITKRANNIKTKIERVYRR